jgi:hypothetical protein
MRCCCECHRSSFLPFVTILPESSVGFHATATVLQSRRDSYRRRHAQVLPYVWRGWMSACALADLIRLPCARRALLLTPGLSLIGVEATCAHDVLVHEVDWLFAAHHSHFLTDNSTPLRLAWQSKGIHKLLASATCSVCRAIHQRHRYLPRLVTSREIIMLWRMIVRDPQVNCQQLLTHFFHPLSLEQNLGSKQLRTALR